MRKEGKWVPGADGTSEVSTKPTGGEFSEEVGGGRWCFLLSPALCRRGSLKLHMHSGYWGPLQPPEKNAPVAWSCGCNRLQWLVSYLGSGVPQERAVAWEPSRGGIDWAQNSEELLAPSHRSQCQDNEADFKLAGNQRQGFELTGAKFKLQRAHGLLQAGQFWFQPHSQKLAWIPVEVKVQALWIICMLL